MKSDRIARLLLVAALTATGLAFGTVPLAEARFPPVVTHPMPAAPGLCEAQTVKRIEHGRFRLPPALEQRMVCE